MKDRLRREIAELSPGYAALVMATGIISTALAAFGWQLLSRVLLVVAVVAFALLLVGYGWRAVRFPGRMLRDARDPGRGFGYFTLVAAPNVLGMRLAADQHLLTASILALASVPVWLVLVYGIPGAMIVGRRAEPVLPRTNGSWFMWVVGTQSLAASAATIAASASDRAGWLAPVAVAFWGIGVVLYLMLAGLVMSRLLDAPVTPHALSPTYWVYMGATAITVLAAAKIVSLPAGPPVLAATRPVVSGLAFLLWAFGTWWIPLLLVFVIWRHLRHGAPLRYDASLWSMVFPLGMYAAASVNYGRATGVVFMVDIARVEIWVAFAVWVGVVVLLAVELVHPGTTLRITVPDGGSAYSGSGALDAPATGVHAASAGRRAGRSRQHAAGSDDDGHDPRSR